MIVTQMTPDSDEGRKHYVHLVKENLSTDQLSKQTASSCAQFFLKRSLRLEPRNSILVTEIYEYGIGASSLIGCFLRGKSEQ